MELIYTNATGASVTLRQTKPFFLSKLDGAGRIRQTTNTFQTPEQDGAFYISSPVDLRNITVEGTILAGSPEEAYEYRRRLLKIFTPKQRGILIYRGKQIACIVEEAGFSQGNIVRAPQFFISLLCPSPFFEDLETIRRELASWLERFSFPLEIVDPGIELGIRQPSQIITVENEGDVPCGCEVVFHALGSLSNPELMNLDTGEFIRINDSLTAGEEIRVFTHFAGKRVVKVSGSSEINAFSLLDIGSTFIQLAVGSNTLRYDADNLDLLEVTVFYRPQYIGV